ncbi:MAG TPA: NAD-dependent epimerase/dehydratase family protein [Acidimicrobiales bacterium]|nr:NAD-dependent epimerase/dehydratase family protein [Acidimicrobiales bacterium]
MSPPSEPVVVTGASGFIGSRLGQRLTGAGVAWRGLDLVPGPGVAPADIRQPLDAAAFAGADLVYHLAALAGVAPSFRDPEGYHRTNAVGTTHVLEAARAAGVRRVVVTSSSSVYGECETPATEDRALSPLSPYAEAKTRAEDIARAFSADLEVVVVRPFTVFGPGQRPDMLIARLIAGERMTLYDFERDFTSVDVVTDALLAAADLALDAPFEVYNAASGRPVRAKALLAELGDLLGRPPDVAWGGPRPGEPLRTWADTTRSRARLGLGDPPSTHDTLAQQVASAR